MVGEVNVRVQGVKRRLNQMNPIFAGKELVSRALRQTMLSISQAILIIKGYKYITVVYICIFRCFNESDAEVGS